MPSEYGSVQSSESSPLTHDGFHVENGESVIHQHHELHRHLSLFDLTCLGVGATIGSGVFVLTGLIAHSQAGPACFLSWAIAGAAACLSGLCYAELGGRFPQAGSSYVYARETMGECASVIAGACLFLEYVGSASAVARSWGDKVVEFARSFDSEEKAGNFLWECFLFVLDPGFGINPCAFLISLASVLLLMGGVKESKVVANTFTTFNVCLVLFMSGMSLSLMKRENMTPLFPSEFGAGGVIRGATSSFFGYIGFDEICCMSGEAINPSKNMPRAIILTLAIVSSLYVTAAFGLTSMVPYNECSETSGFPDGFRYRGVNWAAQVSAIGELVSLPVVVLVTIMAQPRLQYAMAMDGILPPVFAAVDSLGNLTEGTRIAGIVMIATATLVPFTYLNDLISAGILLAFTMTNTSVILIRQSSPSDKPYLLEKLMVCFHSLSLLTGFMLKSSLLAKSTAKLTHLLSVTFCLSNIFIGYKIQTQCQSKRSLMQWHSNEPNPSMYLAPFVPILPLCGSFVNLYLIAQLDRIGLMMIFCYVGSAIGFYFYNLQYGKKNTAHGHRNAPERMISLHEAKRSDTNN